MQIPLLMGLIVPLLVSPVATNTVFLAAYEWEKAQIAADNAGILLGEWDTRTLNAVVASNRLIKGFEILHHSWHLCARVPKTKAVCDPVDRVIEAKIREFHRETKAMAFHAWRMAKGVALSELARFGVHLTLLQREAGPPLQGQRCRLCGEEVYWELEPRQLPLETYLKVAGLAPVSVFIRLRGESSLRAENWDYHFDPAAEGQKNR